MGAVCFRGRAQTETRPDGKRAVPEDGPLECPFRGILVRPGGRAGPVLKQGAGDGKPPAAPCRYDAWSPPALAQILRFTA